jgi:hypothetical protein
MAFPSTYWYSKLGRDIALCKDVGFDGWLESMLQSEAKRDPLYDIDYEREFLKSYYEKKEK